MTEPTDASPDTRPALPDTAPAGSDRRTVLKAAGLVALVGTGGAALAGCSSDTAAAPTASTAPSSAPSSSSPASPSATASSSSSASSAAPSGPSVATAEVPEGGGVILADAAYVVTQPSKGTYKAFSKKCTHQGCNVSQIADREIVCRCHGSHFSIEDGSVVRGPAEAPLPEAETTVSGNQVVISA